MLKLGIMQPYFFPYLGYFELIARTDKWVVFDVVNYKAKSWMNRNRILHPNDGWQYVGVPVNKFSRGTLIKDIYIKDLKGTKDKILGQLQHYKSRAPYFEQVVDLIRRTFAATNSDKLVDLNIAGLAETCAYVGIPFNSSICSEMDLKLENIEHPGQWALRICQQLGADLYLNPPGGKEIFIQKEWDESGIKLEFTELISFPYDCSPYAFTEHLSIIDILMWNDPDEVVSHITGN